MTGDAGPAIRAALAEHRLSHRSRRHPAEVTADRLGDALIKWPDAFDGAARDAIARLRVTLGEIAENAVHG